MESSKIISDRRANIRGGHFFMIYVIFNPHPKFALIAHNATD